MDVNILDINPNNVEKLGFFCRMSKMKTNGNQQKLNWLSNRFKEGLKIKMLELPNRGFIEYIPGEFAWRGINAEGYMVIHCIWVVGKSKGKGFGDLLLNECINDAKLLKMKGVVAVVSDGNWMANNKLFIRNGFEKVAEADPSFNLVVKKFKKVENPSFIDNSIKNQKKYKKGLTILASDQCPYLDDATSTIKLYAEKNNIPLRVIKLKSAKEVREKSPSPHGTYNIVYNGKLLSYCYLLPNEIQKKIECLS